MRSSAALIVACAVLAAASDSPTPVNFNVGEEFHTSIETGLLHEEQILCELMTPHGETIQFRPNNEGDPEKYNLRDFITVLGCAVTVRIDGKADEGVWTLSYSEISSVATKKIADRKYKVTVNEADDDATEVVNETETPIETSSSTTTPKDIIKERQVEYLEDLVIHTLDTGIHHEVKILYFDFVQTESCHIVTPQGDEHNLEDISIEGIKVMNNRDVACGVELSINEDMIGNWTLFSRDTRLSSPIERRLNFRIYMEELVKAWPEGVYTTEGNDHYIRLANPTPFYSTCRLVSPNENDDRVFKRDMHHLEECGFILSNVQVSDSGLWTITFGERTIYKAFIPVMVNEAAVIESKTAKIWEENRPIDIFVGPEDAVYCKVTDPQNAVVFDGFGRCHIQLARVTHSHRGNWALNYGLPGKVFTTFERFSVFMQETAPRPQVITHVEASPGSELLVSCALEGEDSVQQCTFRQPSGRVLVAPPGVGESRYERHTNNVVILKTNVTSSECSLRMSQFDSAEVRGRWRCSVETNATVYHGFMTVRDSDSFHPSAEPTLSQERAVIRDVEGPITMSCYVPSEIKYCYFRARNGSIFTVSPGATPSSMFEYAGAGLDAGECGIRFRSLQAADSGQWSCHVGLSAFQPEQWAVINVEIRSEMVVTVQVLDNGALAVQGSVFGDRPLDYCRFVRSDGLGFTTDLRPDYVSTGIEQISWGFCGIVITRPTPLDRRTWTVAARISGQDVEVYGSGRVLVQPPPPVTYMALGNLWILVVLLSMTIILLALNMTSRRHRQWAYSKAGALRNSFRRRAPATRPDNPLTRPDNIPTRPENPPTRPASPPTRPVTPPTRPVIDPVPSYEQATAKNPV